MAIPLPNLDDRGYADLVAEARALIPSLAPEWTDHNPSDPGITLVELFAWLAEMMTWRANQVPDASVLGFLRLLNGPGWTPSAPLDQEVSAAVVSLRAVDRAVTAADYEALATAGFNAWLREHPETPPPVVPVARARCVARRDLGAGSEAEREADRPGRVSVLVVPERDGPRPAPLEGARPPVAGFELRRAVWRYLEERRLIATRVHVLSPACVPVRLEALLVRREDVPDPVDAAVLEAQWDAAPAGDVRRAALDAVGRWLDPLEGGADGRGWPFGRDVYLSDLYGVLEAVPGVDYVADLRVYSECAEAWEGCEAATPEWHANGDPVGLTLAGHHLPWPVLRAAEVWVTARAVPVGVAVRLDPGATPRDEVRRAVKEAVRGVFHPVHGGPGGRDAMRVAAAAVRAAVRAALPGAVGQSARVVLQADPARVSFPDEPEQQTVRFAPGEAAETTVTLLDLTGGPL